MAQPTNFDLLTPEDILAWVADTFGDRAGLSCSFGGPGGIVLAHMASKIVPKIPVLFLDTDFLFEETYALKNRLQDEWGLVVRTGRSTVSPDRQAQLHGANLWATNPDLCCHLRKVQPMRELLQGVDCWVTGLRRDQSPTRKAIQVLERHKLDEGRVILKINPLAKWTRKDVWAYVHEHQLPYNILLDQGYGSLGCIHCTVPSHDSSERSGRWKSRSKTECGLHTFTTPQDGENSASP